MNSKNDSTPMLEHPTQLNIIQSELKSHVSDYFDNLLAQRDAILERYALTPETAEQFCNLHSTDEDRVAILELYEHMVYVIAHKEVPASEVLVLERIKEQHRVNEFFGKDANIEVPPLPPIITLERIEQWRQQRFELRFLPPLKLKEDDTYPGWQKKPTRVLNLFAHIDEIEHLRENQHNPHLAYVAPNQLKGCWMLIDMRPKPQYQNNGKHTYEDDQDIQTIIQDLVTAGIANREAKDGRRNNVHPKTFDNPEFWQPFYEHLCVAKEEAVIRLPRVIEQSMFGQGEEWDGTTAWEWSEEYLDSHRRLVSGNFVRGGVSNVDCCADADVRIGFRCVAVFSSP